MIFFRKRPYVILQTLNILLAVFLFSCGIEEYYFLPQVPESNIKRTSNTEAEILLPGIDDPKYYYAGNYSIFYRIYISAENTDQTSSSFLSGINPALANDFAFLQSYTNPANSSIISANTFSNRNYFELEFEGTSVNNILPTNGGTLRIRFPTASWEYPVVSFNNGPEIRLLRSSNLISPLPVNLFFLNTSELNSNENAASTVNADVAARTGIDAASRYTYVSMYIVAVGYDNTQFTQIYSKPTHISIFKLPDAN